MALANTLTIVATCIAIAAFVTGLVSVIKRRERSILVFLVTAIGFYSLISGPVALLGLAK
jgi:hypothetical protein